ncbi:cell death protein 3 isoform X1 [Procambarus clarkii]|uniref:Caspase 4 n=1 Tax=Procambarus clarkii TaxID=6728 RepID=A0A9E8K0H4_PROCL|nr:caspase 4 [Procambarus clarkii]
MDPLCRQSSEYLLINNREFLSKVRDDEVPKMLFLSVNPNKVEEEAEGAVGSNSIFTDGDTLGVGSTHTTGDFKSEGGSDSIARLLQKFEKALEERSISPVRRELQLRLLKLSSVELCSTNSLSTLESNFSDESDQLSNDEEDILEFTEIFEMFNYSAPESIKSNFGNIIASKKIPVRADFGSVSKKTFFVYAENKIMMKVCNCLTPDDVFQMYEVLRVSKAVERDDIQDLLSQPVDLKALKSVAGLKDVAFYYLILNLMRKQMLNRLYTHKLSFIFHQIQQMNERTNTPNPDIDRVLSNLQRYPVASRPPGLCLIFIMLENRVGAPKDLAKVRELFEKVFMYDVFVKKDPTAEDVKIIVSKLKAARNKFYDSLMVWFMGHGDKTYLNVKDGQIHRRLDLIEPFTEIEWFVKKPKLFFIQACAAKRDRKRFSVSSVGDPKALSTQTDSVGWRASAGAQWQEKYAEYTDVSKVNSFADTLISYATMWYQYASRSDEGSLYVDTLVDQLREHGTRESIENVLRRVHYNVNTVGLMHNEQGQDVYWKQAPYFESSLQKEFIFPNTQKI